MKKLFLTTGFTLLFMLALPGIIPDANTYILSQILGKDIASLQTMESSYEKIKAFTDFARQTKQSVEKMAGLEQEVQKALKTAKNIKDFKFSDVTFLLGKATGLDLNPASYIPNTALSTNLINKINSSQGNGQAGAALYALYQQPFDLPSFKNQASTGQGNLPSKTLGDQLGVEKYLAAQQGASCEILINFSNRYQQQALEIEQSIKQDDRFSMNTAERMQLLLKAGNLMQESVELKLKAAELLKQPPTETITAVNHAARYIQMQEGFARRIAQSRTYTEKLF